MNKDIETRTARGRGGRCPAPGRRWTCRAGAAEGLLDVAYATVDSPLGPLLVAGHPARAGAPGLHRVARRGRGASRTWPASCRRASSRRPSASTTVRRELDEYFEGRRTGFDLPIDWSLSRGFTGRCCARPRASPSARSAPTPRSPAEAGSPRAVRAAGNALGANPIPVVVPCHRVLRTGGALGGYTGGLERKEFLLRLEGVLA